MLMSVLSKVAARFVRDQRGATMVEYGLLVALIAVVVLTAVGTLGTTITGMFTSVNDGL
jgi:pilus assembly protein Flp/PilA